MQAINPLDPLQWFKNKEAVEHQEVVLQLKTNAKCLNSVLQLHQWQALHPHQLNPPNSLRQPNQLRPLRF